MAGSKKNSKYKHKRKRVFAGTRKHEIQNGGNTSTAPETPSLISPKKTSKSAEKLERNCPLHSAEQSRPLTRLQAQNLGLSERKSTVKANCFKLVDSTLLQKFLIESAVCSSCRSPKGKLILWQDDSKRQGLKENIFSVCSNCKTKVFFSTSKSLSGASRQAEVNVRCVQAGLSSGNGLASLENICGIFNLPKPVTSKNYSTTLNLLSKSSVAEANSVMMTSVAHLKTLLQKDGDVADDDDCFHVSVTLDGTWQKRYGFNSLLGVVFLMSTLTGEVLDYVVKHKMCFECKAKQNVDKSSQEYISWYDHHKTTCSINHTTSAESMEKLAAKEMFSRSITTRGLKYTTYVGDGDSSSFNVVRDAMDEAYKERYIVSKEDCVGHIQKRMGKGLRTFKKSKKKLADGLSVGGARRLTDAYMDRIQNYYGAAIRNNPGNLHNMENAVWAIYYHCIIEKDEQLSEQHRLCPPGAESWCRYQLDIANGTSNYDQSRCLPPVFRSELLPLFTRLSKPELLQKCLKGLTQNQNDSILFYGKNVQSLCLLVIPNWMRLPPKR